MYHAHFDLDASPFSIAPDPHFLYMSERHREALAHLKWGLTSEGGFVLLTGEVGTGKTTLSRCLLEQIPEAVEIAFVINPRLTVAELLATLCEELGIGVPAATDGTKPMVDAINGYLLQAHADGRRVVLVVDEAQNLGTDVLEQIRLLTNLETNERKLLQVILLGQPELATKLAAPELRQLAQRITARFHLTPLSPEELSALVHHRLVVAGARRNPFDAGALTAIHRHARGIPRLANVIADRALLGAYAEGTDTVSAAIVGRAAAEVLGSQPVDAPTTSSLRSPVVLALAGLVLLLTAALGALLWQRDSTSEVAQAPVEPSTAAAEAPAAPSSTSPLASSAASPPTAAAVPGTVQPDDPALPAATQTSEPAAAPASSPAIAPVEAPLQDAPPTTDGTPEWLSALFAQDADSSRRTAMRALLAAWFAPLPLTAQQPPCEQLAGAGLACLPVSANWRTLLDIDRPAILEIWGEDARPRHLALTSVDGERVRIVVDEAVYEVQREDIGTRWRGAATVLWQMPPDYRTSSRRGDDDVTSAWLAERLALVDGGRAQGAFDEALEARVRRFQFDSRLRPDGIVGPRTWMRLNDATGIGAPTLAPR